MVVAAETRICGRGSASGAVALIEVEVRDGLGLGGIEAGRLVNVEAVVGVEGEVGLGDPRAGERAAVMKARMRSSAPQPGQSGGKAW